MDRLKGFIVADIGIARAVGVLEEATRGVSSGIDAVVAGRDLGHSGVIPVEEGPAGSIAAGLDAIIAGAQVSVAGTIEILEVATRVVAAGRGAANVDRNAILMFVCSGAVDMGRIALAIDDRVTPYAILALVPAQEDLSGLYRSTDQGESWEHELFESTEVVSPRIVVFNPSIVRT